MREKDYHDAPTPSTVRESFAPCPELLERARQLRREGHTLAGAAELLTAEAFAAPGGGTAWTPSTVGRLFCLLSVLGSAQRPRALVEKLSRPWFRRVRHG